MSDISLYELVKDQLPKKIWDYKIYSPVSLDDSASIEIVGSTVDSATGKEGKKFNIKLNIVKG